MAIAGELPEGGTQKATFRKGAEGPAEQRGGVGGDQGGAAGDGGEAGAVIRTTRENGGIKVEVIRDDTGQVIWQKFVPWNYIDRLPEVFARASREQERYGKKGGGHGRARD